MIGLTVNKLASYLPPLLSVVCAKQQPKETSRFNLRPFPGCECSRGRRRALNSYGGWETIRWVC